MGMQAAAAIGVASTGTAISTLSGAAAYSSSVAWLGFGSMATGSVVLLGLGAAGGKAFNSIYTRTYAGKKRRAKNLNEDELALVMAAQSLSSSIDGLVESEEKFSEPQRIVLALEGLAPLAEKLRILIGKNKGRSRKLALKPKLSLWREYHQLMLEVENLSMSLSQPSVLQAIRLRELPRGLDALALAEAVKQVGTESSEGLREAYIKTLVLGLDPHWIETGEARAAEFFDTSWDVVKAGAHGAKQLVELHTPTVGAVVADGVSDAWRRMKLPEVTDRKALLGHAKKGMDIADKGLSAASGGLKSSLKTAVRGKNMAMDAAEYLQDRVTGSDPYRRKQTGHNTLSATVVFAVTVVKLVSQEYDNLTLEEDMVLQAMRRAIPELADANATQVSRYLRNLAPEQLRGVLSTCKGTYHELLYVEAQTIAGYDAQLHEGLNHPGSDVIFTGEDGEVLEVQLKAVATRQSIDEHMSRYPGLEIRATEEMAELTGLPSTGFSNSDLSEDVRLRLEELQGNSLGDDVMEAIMTSAVVHAAVASKRILSGSLDREQMVDAIRDSGIAVGTTILLETLLLN